MGDAFSITTPSGMIQLDARRQGGANFSATNLTGQALQARAEVVAQAPATTDWFTIAGEAERNFPVGGTQAYQVDVAVPPTAAPQTYRFRLDVLGTDDPDEQQAQGQWVQFTVSPEPAPARPVPWRWIIVAAAAAVVVLVAAGVVAWVLTHRQATLSPTPTTVNFGVVAVNSPATQSVTVKDTGPVSTTVNATVAGANAADFSVTGGSCVGKTLDPNATCVFEVRFDPPGAGSVVGSLQITGGHAATKTVALTATGGNPQATAPPFTLTFFNNDNGRNWSGMTTVTNTGTTPLHVTSATVNLTSAPIGLTNVSVGNFCSQPVAPHHSCTISVTLRVANLPQAPTPPSGILTITSDAARLQVSFT